MAEAWDLPITRREVEDAIRFLKNLNVPGQNGLPVPSEVWKVGWKLIDYWVEACNKGLNGDVPKDWVDCRVIPTNKKGSINDPDNYRGIALLSTGGKVFRRILAR